MNFKEIDLADVPGYEVLTDRLHAADPLLALVKAGRDFDSSIIRVYVQPPAPARFAVDIPGNLMDDLESDTSNGHSGHRQELLGQLDEIIEHAISLRKEQ